MSSSFDTAQHTLSWLLKQVGDDEQAKQAIHRLKMMIERWHSYSHTRNDELNRVAYHEAELLRTILKYDDPEERAMWLKVKQQGE